MLKLQPLKQLPSKQVTIVAVDETTLTTIPHEIWYPPSGSTASCPVLYRSFDNTDGLVLMEGATIVNTAQLIDGQVQIYV